MGKSKPARKLKKIKLVRQPKGSDLCGQCCVAMILGVTLSTAIRKIGHRRVTYATEIYRALKKRPQGKFKFTMGLKELSVIFVKYKKKRIGHWVVFDGKTIFDPGGSKAYSLKTFKKAEAKNGGKLYFYLEIA